MVLENEKLKQDWVASNENMSCIEQSHALDALK